MTRRVASVPSGPARSRLRDHRGPGPTLGGTMNTRTIAIAALVIAVILVLILVL